MEVSELTLKLIILLTPGAIACLIFEKLTIHKKWAPFNFIANSILFGGISYLVAQPILNIFGLGQSLNNLWLNLPSKEIPFSAMLATSLISIPVGLICAGLDNFKIINRVGKFLGWTSKYGDENLFYYFLQADNIQEVYLRDIPKNITYHGMIDYYSEADGFKEIVLSHVKIYDYKTSDFMYKVDKIYLSYPNDSIVIEVPYINLNNESNG